MCHICDKEVIEQGVLDSDLTTLPYTAVKWCCIVPGCRGGCRIRDYGMVIYYFDTANRKIDKEKRSGRGGWWNCSDHFYLCGKHSKNRNRIVEMMRHRFSKEFFLSKIRPYKQ